MKKDFLVISLIGFMAFTIGANVGRRSVKAIPEFLDVIEDGEILGTARLNTEESLILNVKDNKNPGAYLAFPIYKSE